jgi:hypothetical protein
MVSSPGHVVQALLNHIGGGDGGLVKNLAKPISVQVTGPCYLDVLLLPTKCKFLGITAWETCSSSGMFLEAVQILA